MSDDPLGKAVRALIAAQKADGIWRDYETVPVGASDGWVTAFVGQAMAETGRDDAVAAAAAAEAALRSHRPHRAGLGYNTAIEPDTDSTAWWLLLSSTLGRCADAADVAFLRAHQKADGGFATFTRSDGWGISHPCVTPVAALALLRVAPDWQAGSVLRYGEAQRGVDGMWPAYWWPGPFYATASWLRLWEEAGGERPVPPDAAASFGIETVMDLAFSVDIARIWRLPSLEKLTDELLARQLPDGLWPPSRALRVTDPSCRSTDLAFGTCYADNGGLMTTAVAIRALRPLTCPMPLERARGQAGEDAKDQPPVRRGRVDLGPGTSQHARPDTAITQSGPTPRPHRCAQA